MAVELVRAALRPLEFTIDGNPVFARKLPFRLALNLHSGEMKAEDMAEIVMGCAVKEDGSPAFDSIEAILDHDFDQMVELFQAVSGGVVTSKDARKNLKANRR